MSAEIQANFHTRIPTPHNQNSLVSKCKARFILGRMNDGPSEPVYTRDIWYNGLSILSGSNYKKLSEVETVLRLHSPEPDRGIELGPQNSLLEAGPDGEVGGIGLNVGDEVVLGGVFREVLREIKEWEVAEAFGEMEPEPVVGSLLPQRS